MLVGVCEIDYISYVCIITRDNVRIYCEYMQVSECSVGAHYREYAKRKKGLKVIVFL